MHDDETLNRVLEPYHFELPQKLVATKPVTPADHAKLMQVDAINNFQHTFFYRLDELLTEGDLLVVNNTEVEKRRVYLRRNTSGREPSAVIESVFLEQVQPFNERMFAASKQNEENRIIYHCLLKKRKRLKDGEYLTAVKNSNYEFEVVKLEDNRVFLAAMAGFDEDSFSEIGEMPLPPYMNRTTQESDDEDYQNFFAEIPGSAASPTASLHFTTELKQRILEKKIDIEAVTLHIGYGTFAPLTGQNLKTRKLHKEQYCIPEKLAERLRSRNYRKLVVVGTTALRTLETVYRLTGGEFDHSLEGTTELFLAPPEKIYTADWLITNFHLPGSSLLMLVACMQTPENILKAYNQAISQNYRFYSYGDAMLLKNLNK